MIKKEEVEALGKNA